MYNTYMCMCVCVCVCVCLFAYVCAFIYIYIYIYINIHSYLVKDVLRYHHGNYIKIFPYLQLVKYCSRFHDTKSLYRNNEYYFLKEVVSLVRLSLMPDGQDVCSCYPLVLNSVIKEQGQNAYYLIIFSQQSNG